MRKLLAILVVLFFSTYQLFSQTFNFVADSTRIPPTSKELTDLETASNLVKAQLPSGLQPQFKVYDFGFYSLSRHIQGGYDAVWEIVKSDVAAKPESDYYIIFGREASDAGPDSKIRVELELPRTSQFNCLDDEKRNNIEKYVQAVANQNLSPSAYHGEIKALEMLEAYIYKIIQCECTGIRTSCDLSVDYKFIDPELTGLGFRKKEIQVGDICSWSNGNQGIFDYFGKQVIIDGQPYCITEQVAEGKAIIEASQQVLPDTTIATSISGKVYILDNVSFANGEWDDAKEQSGQHDYVEYWVIVEDSKTNKFYLYSKFTIGQIEVPVTLRGENNSGNRSSVTVSPWGLALKALGNAAIDACMQAVIIRLVDETVNDWSTAWGKVSIPGAIWEGLASLIPWKKDMGLSLIGQTAVRAFAVVLDKAIKTPNYTVGDGITDFFIGFAASGITQLISPKLGQYGKTAFAKGCSKIWSGFGPKMKNIVKITSKNLGFAHEMFADIVKKNIASKISKTKSLASGSKIGYRGSLATVVKHTGGPFDPDNFDVDAFIVNDAFAQKLGLNTFFRNARNLSTEFKNLSDEIENILKTIPGYKVDPQKPFTFRVWTEKEYNDKIIRDGCSLF
jgi:hypothetical protein